jgi:hypothetical protein
MEGIDRRKVLIEMFCGAAVVSLGLTAMPKAAKSTTLGAAKAGAVKSEGLVEEARVSVRAHPRRRRRRNKRWDCWWHRGRRVCGWRR